MRRFIIATLTALIATPVASDSSINDAAIAKLPYMLRDAFLVGFEDPSKTVLRPALLPFYSVIHGAVHPDAHDDENKAEHENSGDAQVENASHGEAGQSDEPDQVALFSMRYWVERDDWSKCNDFQMIKHADWIKLGQYSRGVSWPMAQAPVWLSFYQETNRFGQLDFFQASVAVQNSELTGADIIDPETGFFTDKVMQGLAQVSRGYSAPLELIRNNSELEILSETECGEDIKLFTLQANSKVRD